MSAKAEKAAITVCTVILVILAVIGVFIIAAWAIVTLGDQFFTTVDSDNYYNDYSSTAVLPTLTGADFDYYEASEPGGYIAVIKPEVLEDLTAGGVHEVVVDLNVNDSYFGGNTQLIGVAASSFRTTKACFSHTK